jgi:hypothetical protein
MEDVIIKIYDSEIEANMAKGLLESNNIKSTVFTLSDSRYGGRGGTAQLRLDAIALHILFIFLFLW